MPLRRDVKVCGPQSVEVVLKILACFHPGVSSPQGWLEAAAAPQPRGFIGKALLTESAQGELLPQRPYY